MTTKIPAELSSTPGISDSSNATAITIDSDENIGFNTTGIAAGSTSSASNGTATPKKIVINNDYSTGTTDASLKLYLYNSGSVRQGFTSGSNYDLQYHNSGASSSQHIFYVQNSEVANINSTGLALPNGLGINFQATGDGSGSMGSELLDDYEEGYWTPSLPEGGTVNTTHAATYTKIGRQVIAYFYIVITPTNNTQQFKIGGLPYTCINQGGYYPSGSLGYSSNLDLSTLYPPLVMVNNTYAYFHFNNGNANFVTNSTMQKSGGLPIIGQVIYDAA